MAKFDSYTRKMAEEAIAKRYTKDASVALAFYNGDHWQDGEAWTGPRFNEDHRMYDAAMAEVKRTFVSHNAMAELIDRHVNGVLGREPHWKYVSKEPVEPIEEENPVTGEPVQREGQPPPEVAALVEEAQQLMVEWWNERKVLQTLKRMLAGALATKRGPLRLTIPPDLRDEQGNLPATDEAGALEMIYLDFMGYDEDAMSYILPSATVWTDKNSRKQIGIFHYEEENEQGVKQEKRAELTYLDDAGNTVLRIVNDAGNLGQPLVMPLGGRLLMYEMSRDALITPQLMSQQKSLNKTLTMKDKNDTAGGYLERILFNVKWPMRVTTDAQGNVVEEPEQLFTGPGTTNNFQGQTFVNEAGQTQVLPPSVHFRDPVQSTSFIESGNHTYTSILQEGNQVHYSLAGESTVSGESRKQSRDAYTKDLIASANEIESAARWLLETTLAEASYIAGRPGRFEGLRAVVQCKIDAGPVTADDLRVAAEMWDRGLWDWETACAATGVDDVDAVKQRIEQERADGDMREQAMLEAEAQRAAENPPQNLDDLASRLEQQSNGNNR